MLPRKSLYSPSAWQFSKTTPKTSVNHCHITVGPIPHSYLDIALLANSLPNRFFPPNPLCAVTEPSYYKAVITPQCVTDDLTTAQFSYNFKPRTPCKCEPTLCKQTSLGCECNVPTNFNVTKVEVVYTQPQNCLKFGLATTWNNVSYVLGGNTTNEACPVGYKTATTADRVLVVGLLSQAMKSYVWPKVKGTDDGDVYYCPEGVKSMVYPGNIKTYKSCVSKVRGGR